MPGAATRAHGRYLVLRRRDRGALRAGSTQRRSQRGGGHAMSAQRLVATGALSSSHAVVGDMVGLAVEAASNRNSVSFPRHRLTNLLAGHELIEPA